MNAPQTVLLGHPQELAFDAEAITLALVVASGLHEGKWTLGVVYQQTVERVQLADGTQTVGALAAFHSLRLCRVPDATVQQPGAVLVDAAVANPAPEGGALPMQCN